MTARRGHGEGSIRERADGRWEARISLPGGKRKSILRKTRREVQLALREAQRDMEAGLDVGAKTQTVAQFLDGWLENTAKSTLRASTWQSYRSYIEGHIKPAIGHHRLSVLTPQHVQAMLNDALKGGRIVRKGGRPAESPGLSPRSVQFMRAILRRALGHALRWGLVSRNVATLTDAPRVVQKQVAPLDAPQVRRLMDAAHEDWYGPLFTVAIATGLRQGELFGLRWEDVDVEAGELRVRHALQRIDGKPTLVEPKTTRSRRTMNLPDVAVDALRTQRVRQAERRLLLGARWMGHDDLVFTSTVGTPCNSSNVTHRLQAVLEAAGLPRQRFHDLRHCAASLLLAAGEHPRVVMEVLGHSQIALTMNTYSHVMPAAMKGAAIRMDAALVVEGLA